LSILEDEDALNEDLLAWAKENDVEIITVSAEPRAQHRERLFAGMRSLHYARRHHEQFRHTNQDLRQLLSRLSRISSAPAGAGPRAKELEENLLSLSSRLHTVWDTVGERVASINMAHGVKIIGSRAEWQAAAADGRRPYMPSDFCVSMLSQVWCAEQEITSLEPQLQAAIEAGDVVRASSLGARVAGLKASLTLLAPEWRLPEPVLRLTW